jgi:hypothetical protein
MLVKMLEIVLEMVAEKLIPAQPAWFVVLWPQPKPAVRR